MEPSDSAGPTTNATLPDRRRPPSILDRLTILILVPVVSLWTGLCAVSAFLAFTFSARWGHFVHRWWGRGFCALVGIRVRYEIDPEVWSEGGGIYASNHASLFDIPVLASLPLEFRWVSKAEVGRIPLMGRAMQRMGCYFLQRDRSSRDHSTMKVVEEDLRRGTRIVIFPEGTRTRTGLLLPFKRGAFRTAAAAGVPLFPLAIVGSFEIAPPGKLPLRRGHQVTIRIGPALSPHFDFSPPDRVVADLTERYSAALNSLLEKK